MFCVDNEEEILHGMKSLLSQRDCDVLMVKGRLDVLALRDEEPPYILLL